MLFVLESGIDILETDKGLALKDTQHHCYCDYLVWPEDMRYELIDGIAYAMSPAPDLAHQEVAGEIYRQASNSLAGNLVGLS